jgi:hypothetical protein
MNIRIFLYLMCAFLLVSWGWNQYREVKEMRELQGKWWDVARDRPSVGHGDMTTTVYDGSKGMVLRSNDGGNVEWVEINWSADTDRLESRQTMRVYGTYDCK